MRFFIYEFMCAGDHPDPAGASLLTEGWAMLTALLEDFGRIPGATVETMLGAAVADKAPPPAVIVHHADFDSEGDAFRRLAAAADWTLVVAPEIDGILPDYLEWIEEANGRTLGSTPGAVRLASDKLRLAECLYACGVPTPRTALWPTAAPSFPAVCKLRRGAGSQAAFLVRDENELRQAVAESQAEWQEEIIVQSYVPGQAASVAFLIGPSVRLALPTVAQHLSSDGRFRYQGGSLPLAQGLAHRAERLAARAVGAVKGLHGYVGVDLVLNASEEGDAVIEINPRLTTSYVGLRALARFNLAEAMLAIVQGSEPPACEWRTGLVDFKSDGSLSRLSWDWPPIT